MARKKTYAFKILAVFCAAFMFYVSVPIIARASTAGAGTVYLDNCLLKTGNENESIIYYSAFDLSSRTITEKFYYTFNLFTIPDTKVGQTYVCKATLSGLNTTRYDVVYNTGYGYWHYGTGGGVSNATIFSSLPYAVAETVNLEFTVDALDGSTPVYVYFCSNSTTYRDIGTHTLYNLFNKNIVKGSNFMRGYSDSINASNMSYTLQVGGDDLLSESKKQTEIIQQGNQLQSESNDLQKEANETSKGIFGSIKDFFGGFFDNLKELVLGLVVPTSEELNDILTEMNEWFSARLGFIWYPFDLAVQLVQAFAFGDANGVISVPPLRMTFWGTEYTLWDTVSVDLSSFDIFTYVRTFTSFLLVGWVSKLAYMKWDEWIGGHNA